MKSTLYLMSALLLAASCASPKYTYYFDHYNYGVTKNSDNEKIEKKQASTTATPPDQLLVSKSNLLVERPSNQQLTPTEKTEKPLTKSSINKVERRELKQQIKKYIKEVKAEKVEAGKANNLDHDLKLAAIFGSVGVVALIIGTDAFVVIGGIALIIGVVFFVTWLLRQ